MIGEVSGLDPWLYSVNFSLWLYSGQFSGVALFGVILGSGSIRGKFMEWLYLVNIYGTWYYSVIF